MIAMIAMIAGHATPAIGLQLCGRGGDGGQVGLFFSRGWGAGGFFFLKGMGGRLVGKFWVL